MATLSGAAASFGWFVVFAGWLLVAWYRRVSLAPFTLTAACAVGLYWVFGTAPPWWKALLVLGVAVLASLNLRPLRIVLITRPFLKKYIKLLPSMSSTEREALEAGTVWWDGELFTGGPNWPKLMNAKVPVLSAQEQAFLDGPCETLCEMIDDWDITHTRGDLPPPVWDYLKSQGFFAMIIPRKYGGLEFSAYAHSSVLVKIASRSTTASSTIAVPNSLGPAELLLHYGTEEQKDHYLPRLADGREVPCFALTGPRAGSDAASLPDGDLLLLERKFGWTSGLSVRLRRLRLSEIGTGALVDGSVLFEADLGYEIDNMEGLSVHRGPDGETVLTLVSDDNFSIIQRTLLLQFTLVEP